MPTHQNQHRSKPELRCAFINRRRPHTRLSFLHNSITMGKRSAGSELNKDNWNDKETNNGSEETGDAFSKASQDVLLARRIVKAKRPTPGTQPTTTAEATKETAATTTNPFANVALVAPTKNEAIKPTATTDDDEAKETVFGSTFGGFKGFGNSFSWGTKTTSETGMFTFGNTATSSSSLFGVKSATTSTASPSKEEDNTTAQAVVVLPTSYTVQSGEENEESLLEVKSKSFFFDWNTPSATETPVFQKDTDETAAASTATPPVTAAPTKVWKDTGVGIMRVLLSKATNSIRLVQRQESTHHVLMNVLVTSCRRRPDSNFFEINGARAVKLNPANAIIFQQQIVDTYFSGNTEKKETTDDKKQEEE